MTFASHETSIADGAPVWLYEFVVQNTYFRYTSGSEPQTRNGQLYEPETLSHGDIESAGVDNDSKLDINTHRASRVAQLFNPQPPSSIVFVTIYEKHLTDADVEYKVAWQGRVLSVTWSDSEAKLNAEASAISFARPGLQRLYSKACPYVLYGPGCNLSAALFTTSVSTFEITEGVNLYAQALDGVPDEWYAGGYIEYENSVTGLTEYRSIVSSSAGTIVLALVPVGIANTTLKVTRGCPHNVEGCKTFDNLLNYGGQPFIPTKNPFGGTNIY